MKRMALVFLLVSIGLSDYTFELDVPAVVDTNYPYVANPCDYFVTFHGYYPDNPNFYDWETITITVNRPVNVRRVCNFWLSEEDGADLNKDGVVDFLDYALLMERLGQ